MALSFSNFQLELKSELRDVCKGTTEEVDKEAVTELDAVNVPGIVCGGGAGCPIGIVCGGGAGCPIGIVCGGGAGCPIGIVCGGGAGCPIGSRNH